MGVRATLCLHGHLAPTILLLGGQKCGSSSLWFDLMTHVAGTVKARPRAGSEPPFFAKEQHFFDDDERFREGMPFYVSHYPTCTHSARARYAIDASPSYLFIPGTAARVHAEYVGHRRALRMIVILRNPTDRVLSWYGHVGTDRGHVNLSRDEFVYVSVREMCACAAAYGLTADSDELWASPCRELRPPLYDALTSGLYAPQIAEWLRWFPASQIALVTFGGYVKRANKVLHDLAAFIGQGRRSGGAPAVHARALAGASRIAAAHRNVRSTKRTAFGAGAHAALTEFYRPHVDALIMLLQRPAAEHMFSTPFSPASALTARGLVEGTM
ncbi:hypothetical protein KFE25_003480 [Diacronema lutheri]|uniref:Sulfotransferase domain-containing protein n=1 Tax=Diacronema lutheri TaxID=2081491 RepID=A0A8J5XME9_DIALT|nr:hypothetical protein KFE25_003480 [Diacronema lutheri]